MAQPAERFSQPSGEAEGSIDEATRQHLEELRQKLLRLHKALLDYERVHYERAFGRVASTGEMLQLVIHDQWFAWLHPLSDLIVRIDETVDWLHPGTARDARETLEYTRILLAPSETGGTFGGNYFLALQREPAVGLAHADVRKILKKTV